MNALMILTPYKFGGQWVFDDAHTGLVREPFIAGIDSMIDRLVVDIPFASGGFLLCFSQDEFPGYMIRLDWRREEFGGNWYWCNKYKLEGWLCPALFKYFESTPKTIYVKATAYISEGAAP